MESSLTSFFSVCIPVWGIKGNGVDYLEYSLNILAHQQFKDFEVVISDHSTDEYIKECCSGWSDLLNINYIKCETGRGKISPNLNNAIRNCKGKYIKFLFQDDFLYDEYSLSTIHAFIQNNDTNWLLTGCAHTKDMVNIYDVMIPYYHDKIYEGLNTISCPTVLTIKNTDDKLYFDEDVNWLMDVEYYKRLFDKYGLPDIMPHIGVINRQAEVRATNLISEEQKQAEVNLMIQRYGTK